MKKNILINDYPLTVSDKLFNKVWDLALPYQDKRDDKGHAQIVTWYAIKLTEMECVDSYVTIPAAILHDIGWSQLTRKERFLIFDITRTREQDQEIRIKHQNEGVKLGREILIQVKYPQQHIDHILEIVSQHDTRNGFYSQEDGVMRDADKLWRVSRYGFAKDLKRSAFTPQELFNKQNEAFCSQGFLFSKSAIELARKKLEKRKIEYNLG